MALFSLVGFHMGIASTFGFIYFERELGAEGALLGLTLTAQALLEVPLFQVAARIINCLGYQNALLTCMFAAALRFFGWTAMPSMPLVLPFEVAHGWTFAIYYTALSLYSDQFASRGLQATMLGAGNSFSQLGSLVATLGWSVVVEHAGLRSAFVYAQYLFTVASLPLLVAVARLCIHSWDTGACTCLLSPTPLLNSSAMSSDTPQSELSTVENTATPTNSAEGHAPPPTGEQHVLVA